MSKSVGICIRDVKEATAISVNLHIMMDSAHESIENKDETYKAIMALDQQSKDRLAVLGAATISLAEFADNMVKEGIKDIKSLDDLRSILGLVSNEAKTDMKGVDEDDVEEQYVPSKERHIDPMYG